MNRTEEKRATVLADQALSVGFEDDVVFQGANAFAVVLRDGTPVLIPIHGMTTREDF
jgi:hypothetical protein